MQILIDLLDTCMLNISSTVSCIKFISSRNTNKKSQQEQFLKNYEKSLNKRQVKIKQLHIYKKKTFKERNV